MRISNGTKLLIIAFIAFTLVYYTSKINNDRSKAIYTDNITKAENKANPATEQKQSQESSKIKGNDEKNEKSPGGVYHETDYGTEVYYGEWIIKKNLGAAKFNDGFTKNIIGERVTFNNKSMYILNKTLMAPKYVVHTVSKQNYEFYNKCDLNKLNIKTDFVIEIQVINWESKEDNLYFLSIIPISYDKIVLFISGDDFYELERVK